MGTDLATVALIVILFIGYSRDRKFDRRMTDCNNKIDKISKS